MRTPSPSLRERRAARYRDKYRIKYLYINISIARIDDDDADDADADDADVTFVTPARASRRRSFGCVCGILYR